MIQRPVIGPFPIGKDSPLIHVEETTLHNAPRTSGSYQGKNEF